VAAPFGTAYLQCAADVRSYAGDAACSGGLTAPADPRSLCGVARVRVAGGVRTASGRYGLSLKFPDGARRELFVSPATYRLFAKPGTPAFAQFRRGRLTLFGDARRVEATVDLPANRIPAAGDSALTALIIALAATAVAASFARGDVRGDVRIRRPNDAG
jgi:hypothetical protein